MQCGASFRNPDVARLAKAAAMDAPGPFFVIDIDSPIRQGWTVITSMLLLYTIFWVGRHCVCCVHGFRPPSAVP
jgi:hypothetical protein